MKPEKPLIVHLTPAGPNSWKVVMTLEELGLKYEIDGFKLHETKQERYLSINPNGRVPGTPPLSNFNSMTLHCIMRDSIPRLIQPAALTDPNTNIILWESGAIVHYLVTTYDTAHKLTHTTPCERALEMQWLMFQMSGQGPYFGQASWFHWLHPEPVKSARDRYDAEVRRILGVLDGALKERQWLVGEKMTFADLVFLPYLERIALMMKVKQTELFAPFGNVRGWVGRMSERESWMRSMRKRTEVLDGLGLDEMGVPKEGVHMSPAEHYGSAKAQDVEGVGERDSAV